MRMDPRAEGAEIRSLPRAFINKRGEAILLQLLDDVICQRLVEMYLAYQPRNSFQGLPPVKDEACVKWVQDMIAHGINLVALSFTAGVVGHVALFPMDNLVCELFVVVSPPFQNMGIGTELIHSAVQVAYEIGFERIWLDVESTNVRARHVYKKCGFAYLPGKKAREIEMALDLKRYRAMVEVCVRGVMSRAVTTIGEDESCRKALDLFLSSRISTLPVVNGDGRLLGMLSEVDLMQPANLDKQVRDIYARQVLTARPDWPVARVVRLFQSSRVRSIPVVDDQQHLVGIIGRKDILAWYADGGTPAASP